MKGFLLSMFLCLALCMQAFTQPITDRPSFLLSRKEKIVMGKNYPFLSYLLSQKEAVHQLDKVPALQRIALKQWQVLKAPVSAGTEVFQNYLLNESDIAVIGQQLVDYIDKHPAMATQLKQLPVFRYGWADGSSLKERIEKEWEKEAEGINWTINVYGNGQKPHYPAIDSISEQIMTNASAFQQMMATQLSTEIVDSMSFCILPLKTALQLLELNGRMDAADYEPMEQTVNLAAVRRVPTINWNKYPYTHILIPGAGPENLSDSLNPDGILRCRLAAILYHKGLAPFIIPSGGRVHPYKTTYSEAAEMKKYLIHELGIPEYAIIMEPHARHTTTNIRNTVRLLAKYHIPTDKRGIISTTEGQSASIRTQIFAERCRREMGIVPYSLGKPLSLTATEYLPDLNAVTVTPTEPLDP